MVQTTLATWLSKPQNSPQNTRLGSATDIPLKSTGRTYASVLSSFPIDPTNPIKAGETLRSNPRPPPAKSNPTSNEHSSNTATTGTSPSREASISTVAPPTAVLAPRNRPLPPSVSLSPATGSTLASFQRLNALLLPIPYPQSFYNEILNDPVTASITLLAIWRDVPTAPGIVVGGIRCRLRPPSDLLPPHAPPPSSSLSSSSLGRDQQQDPTLYISTLAVLSPYRRYGIASHLLHAVLVRAARTYGLRSVVGHVWEANQEALAWYERRGFKREAWEEGYYRRLDPGGAWRIVRGVKVEDMLNAEGSRCVT